VLILFGVAVLMVFIGIGAIIAVTAWFQQNLQVETRTADGAEQEFDAVRRQFGDRLPLLEMHGSRPQYTAEHDKPAPASPARLESLHVLAWDPDEQHLARVSIPFWLLRLKAEPLRLSAYASGFDGRIDLRPEDIEKYGPGIILDTQRDSGDRVLLWAR
jgi:hypothetical protein